MTSLADAVAAYVHDGDIVAIEGFTHLISFAAGHEIIRQGRRELTLCRLTPDLIYDQMIAAGVASKLVFSWLGNPGVGSLHAIRKAIETGKLEIEEYTHFSLAARYAAGASRLPFLPVRTFADSDLPRYNANVAEIESPFEAGTTVSVVPPLRPDVAIVHAQRASAAGHAQIWGFTGCQQEAALAATRCVVVCEELVDDDIIRADPNRTVIPGACVDAVVVEPYGCHPSYAQGYYDRDNAFYLEWDEISRDAARLRGWLDEWVCGTRSHQEYVTKLGEERLANLAAGEAWSAPVNYGVYA